MDLKPDPYYKRVLVPGSGWGQRPAVAPKPQYGNQTMAVVCPKCKAAFRHPHGLGATFCKASEPPFFGPNRGCGWLIAVMRPYEGGTQARADAVMDCMRYWRADRGDFYIPRVVLKRIFAAVYERWEQRGYGRTIVREDGSIDFQEMSPVDLAALAATADRTTPRTPS